MSPTNNVDTKGEPETINGSQPERFDILVLGSGEGGKYLAWHMAQSGNRTAVVERQWIGGSCPNINCLPSKNEIWSAKVADLVSRATELGVVTGPGAVVMAQVQRRKRAMVEGLIGLHLDRFKAIGAELIMGTGRFVAPKTLEVHLNDGGYVVLSERDAGRLGLEVGVARLPVGAVLRTRTISEMSGLMKALVEAGSDRILGLTMLGPEAGEVMAVVQTAMMAGMPYTELRDLIFTHPMMAEGLVFLFANILPKAARLPRADETV